MKTYYFEVEASHVDGSIRLDIDATSRREALSGNAKEVNAALTELLTQTVLRDCAYASAYVKHMLPRESTKNRVKAMARIIENIIDDANVVAGELNKYNSVIDDL